MNLVKYAYLLIIDLRCYYYFLSLHICCFPIIFFVNVTTVIFLTYFHQENNLWIVNIVPNFVCLQYVENIKNQGVQFKGIQLCKFFLVKWNCSVAPLFKYQTNITSVFWAVLYVLKGKKLDFQPFFKFCLSIPSIWGATWCFFSQQFTFWVLSF